jgi:hypothetical protein
VGGIFEIRSLDICLRLALNCDPTDCYLPSG